MCNDARAKILIEGPPKGSKHCEGCPLFGFMLAEGDHCPYFGDVYRETTGEDAGLHCRPDECLAEEVKNEGQAAPPAVPRMMCPRCESGVHKIGSVHRCCKCESWFSFDREMF